MVRYLPPIALVACVSADPPRVEPEPVIVAPAVEPKQAEPVVTKIEVVESGARSAICLHTTASKDCVSLEFDPKTQGIARGTYTPGTSSWTGHDMIFERKPCKLLDGTLTCEGRAPVTFESYSTAHYAFLRDGDRLWWYENVLDIDVATIDKPQVIREMKPLPRGIKQLVVAFRTACAIAGDDSVWCWSDPRRPQRATVPAGTIEIFLQEPFELCARTASGAVSCSPAIALDDLVCDKRNPWCGQQPSSFDGRATAMRGRFDPLSAILRPQQAIELGHAAARIVRDDSETRMHCDHGIHKLRIEPGATGGCALGTAGEVTCFAPCGTTWDAYKITGMPAVAEIWVDDDTGYARTSSGALYAWPNPRRERQNAACTPFPDVPARHLVELPRVTHLTGPIGVIRGPHWYIYARCAISDGRARCWTADKAGLPTDIRDPRTLPPPRPRR